MASEYKRRTRRLCQLNEIGDGRGERAVKVVTLDTEVFRTARKRDVVTYLLNVVYDQQATVRQNR